MAIVTRDALGEQGDAFVVLEAEVISGFSEGSPHLIDSIVIGFMLSNGLVTPPVVLTVEQATNMVKMLQGALKDAPRHG